MKNLSFVLIFCYTLLFGQNKPNVIFILSDDLGYGDLGCYGNKYIKTPNIDSLAAMGCKYSRAYAPAPVCSPSRASILSGLNPARLQLTNYLEGRKGDTNSTLIPANFVNEIPSTITSIAAIFKSKGYTTGMVGKWHLGKTDESQPCKYGFDWEAQADNAIFYYDFKLKSCNKVTYESKTNEHLTDVIADQANSFIQNNKNQPFFLYLAHFAPHLVLQNEPRRVTPYYFTYNKFSDGKYDPQYAATVSHLDEAIGKLIKQLRELKLLENTIIVFTSDNGGVSVRELGVKPTDNSPLKNGKGHLNEGGIRVPFIIYDPTSTLSRRGEEKYPITTSDVYPTFAELITKSDFKSSSDYLSLKKRQLQKNFMNIWHYPHFSNQGGRPASAIVKDNMKLIYFYEDKHVELYDIVNDISESNNLAKNQSEMAEKMKTELFAQLKAMNAEMPTYKNSK
ncbi:MAG: sulfatase [Bacteroidota bacterium]|nr:sulfatase [Bacteroidota bacterium]